MSNRFTNKAFYFDIRLKGYNLVVLIYLLTDLQPLDKNRHKKGSFTDYYYYYYYNYYY